jgi:hypothetical protein
VPGLSAQESPQTKSRACCDVEAGGAIDVVNIHDLRHAGTCEQRSCVLREVPELRRRKGEPSPFILQRTTQLQKIAWMSWMESNELPSQINTPSESTERGAANLTSSSVKDKNQ